MNVLVTGGKGFIGRYVQAELADRGMTPSTLDHPADVRSISDVSLYTRDVGAVIHMAGVLGTHELFDAPHLAVDVNVKGTLNVLQACHRRGLRYVGISMPQTFPSIYTATKLAAVGLERAFHHEGVSVSRVRAFNAYGPGQKYGTGHPQKIVPTFAMRAWRGLPIPVWGDGEQTVDLIHAADLARLLVDALQWGDDFTIDGGTGVPVTVNEVAEFVLDVTRSKAGVQHLPMRRGETPTRIVAEGEGWQRLDWKPRFEWEMLTETVLAYREQAQVAA
jgi:UDP-glucose 4-epimerase